MRALLDRVADEVAEGDGPPTREQDQRRAMGAIADDSDRPTWLDCSVSTPELAEFVSLTGENLTTVGLCGIDQSRAACDVDTDEGHEPALARVRAHEQVQAVTHVQPRWLMQRQQFRSLDGSAQAADIELDGRIQIGSLARDGEQPA
ncbi:MAG TPA: hypothetical protein VM869_08120 [Enhygromyxa sp.]|nr:hypothetical protein [Enhygromyxa sp.]